MQFVNPRRCVNGKIQESFHHIVLADDGQVGYQPVAYLFAQFLRVLLACLLEEWEELPPVFITSSETGLGGDELTAYIESLNASLTETNGVS